MFNSLRSIGSKRQSGENRSILPVWLSLPGTWPTSELTDGREYRSAIEGHQQKQDVVDSGETCIVEPVSV
jgi:hypothetical protein